jgi:16S rRNA C967 or C1407 C5-methylase (RsmB/RsmF family)/NOL1/NOP2/fmu family ribosome biogenesis protein
VTTGYPAMTEAFPPAFMALMAQLLGSEAGAFFDALHQPPVRALRLRDAVRFFPKEDLLSPVPWSQDAWYVQPASALGTNPLHQAGAYYLQDASAMVPAAALAPQDGARVLDLCAAPGGKSVQLAHMVPHGLLLANEINPSRAQVLSANVERMGLANCMVTCMPPDKLAARLPQAFDYVLVDAPCSGEGMFRKNPTAHSMWSPEHVAGCARRQMDILRSAATLTAPGGRMAYSTCTFNTTENEGVVDAFLQEHPGWTPVPFALPGLPAAPDGRLKLWPHRIAGEGQFVALLQKPEDVRPTYAPPFVPRADQAALRDAHTLMKEIIAQGLRPDALLGTTAVVLPPACLPVDGLVLLRLGLHAVRQVGRSLRPDHALALSATPTIQVPVNEAEARAFLRGETLPVPLSLRGWTAPSLSGFALGWGKAVDGVLKNHVPKGLRVATQPVE